MPSECIYCTRNHLTLFAFQIILHLGTEVHLTSFESKLDLPISALFQGLTSTRDEIRGDMQTIMKTLRRLEQRMEQRMEQHEDAPTLQYHVSENSITTQVRPS